VLKTLTRTLEEALGKIKKEKKGKKGKKPRK
jgi:hypothetical protein